MRGPVQCTRAILGACGSRHPGHAAEVPSLTCRAGAGTGESSQALSSSCTAMSATWRLKPAEGSASLGASTSSSKKWL